MSRVEALRRLFREPRSFIFDQQNQPNLGEAEQQTGFELMMQSGRLLKMLKADFDDALAAKLEQDEIRPFSARLREFGLRHHLMVARPLWGWPTLQEDASSVAYVGGEDLLRLLEPICARQRLSLVRQGSGWGAGQERWNQLRKSPVCVLDFTAEDPVTRATVAYSLGCALALGVVPVVVSRSVELPFDIDLPPTVLGGDGEDEGRLSDGIDRASFTYPSVGARSSVPGTLTELAAMATGDDATTSVLSRRIAEGRVRDPLDARGVARQLLASSADAELALLTPIWPGFYPADETPRCFHVMPFSRDWSNAARETVRTAASSSGFAYRRGDESDENRVIRAIWEEICEARRVVVDLTGLNANVCIELGLAHALGRPALLVSRDQPSNETLFPEIRKLQVARYGDGELGPLVEKFLDSPPAR